MNLWLKYVLPINAAILIIWGLHTWWDQRVIRQDFLTAEVNAILHLGQGLRLSVGHHLRQADTAADPTLFHEFVDAYPELDIMLLDRDSRVLAATTRDREGQIWREAAIDEVLKGEVGASWGVANHQHEGEQVIDASVGVPDETGRTRYVIHVAKALRAMRAAQSSQLASHLVFAVALLLAVGLAVNLLTYRLLLKPLRRIDTRLQRQGWAAQNTGSSRGDKIRGDEMQRLERTIEGMLEEIASRYEDLQSALGDKDRLLQELSRLRDGLADEVERVRLELSRAQAELVRNERISLLATLTSGLAHELRNPLHIVRGTAETAARRHPEVAPYVSDIMEEVDRIERLVRELLCYARPVEVNREPVDLRQLLERVVRRGCGPRRGAACLEGKCQVQLSEASPSPIADPVLLEQALLNLLTNACESGGAQVELSVESGPCGTVLIRVLDRGTGIDPEDQPRLFEPFFTRKPSGTGLGLPVVQRIAEIHDGSIELKPRAGGGTEAVLCLPAAPGEHLHG